MGERACCPVLLRIREEACGPRPPHHLARSVLGSRSSGHFSQRILHTGAARSPQDPRFVDDKINNLQVDESISLIPALVADIVAGCTDGLGCWKWMPVRHYDENSCELPSAGWRKGVGVEPTKDRQATSTGFEVRPPHRGRFPSISS